MYISFLSFSFLVYLYCTGLHTLTVNNLYSIYSIYSVYLLLINVLLKRRLLVPVPTCERFEFIDSH